MAQLPQKTTQMLHKNKACVKANGERVEVQSTLETDVGIEQYLNRDMTGTGIQGIIKHLYSDFAVNEVDLEGSVVVIKNLELPEVDLKKPMPSDEQVCHSALEVYFIIFFRFFPQAKCLTTRYFLQLEMVILLTLTRPFLVLLR